MPSRARSGRSSPRHRSPRTSTSPASGIAEAFEDLDRRGLAGAVRTEHAETLAGADLEIEAGHRGDVAVTLGQAAAAQALGSETSFIAKIAKIEERNKLVISRSIEPTSHVFPILAMLAILAIVISSP